MTATGILMGLLQAALLLFLAPLFSGFSRVMRAKIQSRQGPPLTQNYLDLAKLMKRQQVIADQAGWIFRITPYLSIASILLIVLLIPILITQSPFGLAGDLILVVYLFALPRFFNALAGLETGNTFAGIGARRELFMGVLVEPVLLLVVFVMALLAGSTNLGVISELVATGGLPLTMAFWLSLAAFAFATFIEMGKLPFDMGEAEQELQEGPLVEYSGRSLALMKWGIYLKQLVLVALFIAIFLPFGSMVQFTPIGFLLAFVVFLLKALLFYFIAAILENVMARMRFMKVSAAAWLALGAAVLSFVFYLANV